MFHTYLIFFINCKRFCIILPTPHGGRHVACCVTSYGLPPVCNTTSESPYDVIEQPQAESNRALLYVNVMKVNIPNYCYPSHGRNGSQNWIIVMALRVSGRCFKASGSVRLRDHCPPTPSPPQGV